MKNAVKTRSGKPARAAKISYTDYFEDEPFDPDRTGLSDRFGDPDRMALSRMGSVDQDPMEPRPTPQPGLRAYWHAIADWSKI